jgi:hypothetical protein
VPVSTEQNMAGEKQSCFIFIYMGVPIYLLLFIFIFGGTGFELRPSHL